MMRYVPDGLTVLRIAGSLALLGTAAGVSAAEELIINLMSGTLDRNRRSVFHPERGRPESETH